MSTEVTDSQIAIKGLTQGTNLLGAGAPRADSQIAIKGLTQGTNLLGASVPRADSQIAIEGLTQGTNLLGVGREGQANPSHYCQSDSNHSILLATQRNGLGVFLTPF
jgi:hypothetical protein